MEQATAVTRQFGPEASKGVFSHWTVAIRPVAYTKRIVEKGKYPLHFQSTSICCGKVI